MLGQDGVIMRAPFPLGWNKNRKSFLEGLDEEEKMFTFAEGLYRS